MSAKIGKFGFKTLVGELFFNQKKGIKTPINEFNFKAHNKNARIFIFY